MLASLYSRARPRAALVAAVLAVGGCVAACGSNSSPAASSAGGSEGTISASQGSGGSSGKKLTTVHVGVLPVANAAPFFLGMKLGYFKQQGLNLSVSSSLSGAPQLFPDLLKGSLQFVDTAWMSLLLARNQGLPISAIAPGDHAGTGASTDYCHVMTAPSGPTSLSQLAGKTVAVNTLKNIGQVAMDATLQKAGVSPSAVKYVQLPWPEMGSALRGGRIAAGWVCEPFLTQLKQQMKGVHDLGPSQANVEPNLPVSVYVTSKQYAASHADIVRRFQSALEKSLAYAAAHPSVARTVVPNFTDISSGIAKVMILPGWSPSYDLPAVQTLANDAKKYGLINQSIKASGLVVPQG